MPHDTTFYVGSGMRAMVRVLAVDAVTEALTPEADVPDLKITFVNPDATTLQELTLGSGVFNAGDGWYHGSATPEQEGMHTIKFEAGTDPPTRERLTINVEAF